MKNKIKYLKSGYLDMTDIIENKYPFCFIVGARGTGKTFGALDYVYTRPDLKFVFMRRTQEQCNTVSRQDFSPFKAVEAYHNNERLIACRSAGKNMGKYGDIILNEEGEETGFDTQGYAVALSTVANMRGFDMSDMPSSNRVWGEYLYQNGYRRFIIPDSCPDCYTVKDFCKEHPRGKYILATGTHVICVVNGNYYDSWDSGNEVPIYYWRKENNYV